MLCLYPAIKPNFTKLLPVDDIHDIYIEESGNPNGLPVVVLHGGPGAGCHPDNRRYFDPEIYRIILFDQRGCGHSTPHAELKNNTTENLLQDMEKIREYLNIKQWILFGGSWGSTLALLYAQANPDKCLGLILRGIFLSRQKDCDWIFEAGLNKIFPDYWEEFIAEIDNKQHNLIHQYYTKLTGEDELHRMSAAKAWALWEMRCAGLHPHKDMENAAHDPFFALAYARISCHYLKQKGFINENQILANMDKIKHLPGIIVHGRFDMICPMENAYDLSSLWPNAELDIIREAGHTSLDPALSAALITATKKFGERFGPHVPPRTS